jgi:hypothetical protein
MDVAKRKREENKRWYNERSGIYAARAFHFVDLKKKGRKKKRKKLRSSRGNDGAVFCHFIFSLFLSLSLSLSLSPGIKVYPSLRK